MCKLSEQDAKLHRKQQGQKKKRKLTYKPKRDAWNTGPLNNHCNLLAFWMINKATFLLKEKWYEKKQTWPKKCKAQSKAEDNQSNRTRFYKGKCFIQKIYNCKVIIMILIKNIKYCNKSQLILKITFFNLVLFIYLYKI